MDKSSVADKRRKDKRHKKPPPPKSSKKSNTQEINPAPSISTTSAPLIVYDDRYSKRPIESNWNCQRNLSAESESEDEQLSASDFEKLLQLPVTDSGHFFFSTEKHWIAESSETPITNQKSNQLYGNYFQIDTKLLKAGIETIPFYERNDYAVEAFSKQEIDSMKLKAEYAVKKYNSLCGKNNLRPTIMAETNPPPPIKCLIGADALPNTSDAPNVDTVVRPPVPCLIGPLALPPELRNTPGVTGSNAPNLANLQDVNEKLDNITLSDKRNTGNPSEVPIASGSSTSVDNLQEQLIQDSSKGKQGDTKEDIQQWLDDILDI